MRNEEAPTTRDEGRPLGELRDTGLLWLINRVVFHPRGFALALHADDEDTVTGWSLLGDGSEAWSFPAQRERELYRLAEQTLSRQHPTDTTGEIERLRALRRPTDQTRGDE